MKKKAFFSDSTPGIAFRLLTRHWFRLVLTSLSIALCAFLMLFLMSFYKGASHGTMDYLRSCNGDAWVLQKHAVNILRNISIVPVSHERKLRNMEGIDEVSPVLFIFASIRLPNEQASIYLIGFDPKTGAGGPPSISRGRNIRNNREIVLDESFAKKYSIHLGDKLPVRNDSLIVTGFSSGTNMLVLQYAFITLEAAHDIIGLHQVVSAYQLKLSKDASFKQLKADISETMDDVAVFDRETFLENNTKEMNSGILPMLLVITLIAAVVLTVILSLILYIHVLEKRKDFAVMKALGSQPGFISRLVIAQSLILSGMGFIITMIIYFPLIQLIENVSPEILTMTTPVQILLVLGGVLTISIISAVLPLNKIRWIYPLEVFT